MHSLPDCAHFLSCCCIWATDTLDEWPFEFLLPGWEVCFLIFLIMEEGCLPSISPWCGSGGATKNSYVALERWMVFSLCGFCSSDDEIPSSSDEEQVDKAQEKRRRPPKRKLKMEDYPDFLAKRYADFRTYRNSVLQKWHEKTKLASGKMGKARLVLCVRTCLLFAEICGISWFESFMS